MALRLVADEPAGARLASLVYFIASSIDGFIAAPDGNTDRFGAGDHIDAQAAELPETLPAHVRPLLGASDTPKRFGTVLMGARTYRVGLDGGFADPYAPLETVVFSRSLSAPLGSVRIVKGDPAAEVRRLKESATRDLWLCGGGEIAAQVHGEIDELVVKLNPFILGTGIPLFGGGTAPQGFALRDTRRFESGVCWLRYERMGA